MSMCAHLEQLLLSPAPQQGPPPGAQLPASCSARCRVHGGRCLHPQAADRACPRPDHPCLCLLLLLLLYASRETLLSMANALRCERLSLVLWVQVLIGN